MSGLLSGESEEWPVFSKAADDRVGIQSADGDIVILEGWCIGCLPQEDGELALPVNDLETTEDPTGEWRKYVNEQVSDYLRLQRLFNVYMYINIPDFSSVLQWRTQQSISNGESPDFDVQKFVAYFERLSRHMMTPSGRITTGVELYVNKAHDIETYAVH